MGERVNSLVDKSKEYRAPFIIAAITGKIDVCNIKAPEGESHAATALS